jgi:hypothetical protein
VFFLTYRFFLLKNLKFLGPNQKKKKKKKKKKQEEHTRDIVGWPSSRVILVGPGPD